MDTMLVRERYKVVRVLDARENYAFAEAVDILDREKSSCLLNIYEGPLLRAYLPCFDRLDACPDFQGMFLEGESLVAVFRYRAGPPSTRCFTGGTGTTGGAGWTYAQKLLHQVLNMADLPARGELRRPAVGERAGGRETTVTLHLRFQVAPMEEMNGRELVYLACDQLRKILLPRFSSPREQLEFLDELEEGRCTTAVQLYALWREREPEIRAAYEALDKKNFFRRWCALLWGRVKRLGRPAEAEVRNVDRLKKWEFSWRFWPFWAEARPCCSGTWGGVPFHPDVRGGRGRIPARPPPTRRGASMPWAARTGL